MRSIINFVGAGLSKSKIETLRNYLLWIVILLAILIILLFLFSSPPIKLKEAESHDPWSQPATPITNPDTGKFLLAEYQKAIDEIKMRISYQDT